MNQPWVLDVRNILLTCRFLRALEYICVYILPSSWKEGGALVRDFFVKVHQDFSLTSSWTGERGLEGFWRCDTGTLTWGDGLRTRSHFLNTSLCWQLSLLWNALSHLWSILVFLWWCFYCGYSAPVNISSSFNSSLAKKIKLLWAC